MIGLWVFCATLEFEGELSFPSVRFRMKARYRGDFHREDLNTQDPELKSFRGDNIKYLRTKKATQVEDIVDYQGLTL